MAALRENFKADNFKYLLCDAHKDGTRAVVNFNIQNRKNEWSGLPDSSSTHSRVSETSATPDIKINTLAQQEKDIAEAESSTLRVQKYCLTEYIQNPETIQPHVQQVLSWSWIDKPRHYRHQHRVNSVTENTRVKSSSQQTCTKQFDQVVV